MSEQSQNNPEYLNHHPNAVQDVDKAHVLAKAGDFEETHAAAVRHRALTAIDGGVPGVTQDELHDEFTGVIMVNEEYLPDMYNETKAVFETYPDITINGLVKEIKEHQKDADEQYKFAGEVYDKLKATKR